jgi:hypothetical protein
MRQCKFSFAIFPLLQSFIMHSVPSFISAFVNGCELGSSVSTATDYRLDGLGLNPGGGKIF